MILATKRSDKYLLEEKPSKKKKTSKKGKKSKKSKIKDSSSESEEGKIPIPSIQCWSYNQSQTVLNIPFSEPTALHVVSSLIEMPEGASLSDNDDNDKNDADDPHRALDIDLDS